jgi:hypothetical protein
MICIKADVLKELINIDDELKAIYHSKNIVFFFTFENREYRNEFIEKTKEITKVERETIYQEYQS